jgi:hypothetical protein
LFWRVRDAGRSTKIHALGSSVWHTIPGKHARRNFRQPLQEMFHWQHRLVIESSSNHADRINRVAPLGLKWLQLHR